MKDIGLVFEQVKYNALEYIGVYKTPESDLVSILTSVTEQHGPEIFFDPEALRTAMQSAGATQAEVYRVCLMTQVTGFHELVDQDSRTVQAGLDRYIQNAAAETGFNRDTILRLTSSLAIAVGTAMNYEPQPGAETAVTAETMATLATSLYQAPLDAFQTDFFNVVLQKAPGIALDFESLEVLANIGIPKAKYYLGYCLLKGIQLEQNEVRGLELLQEAAQAGDSRAAAALGDYYYIQGGANNWTRAYGYYTGFGAAALNKPRKNALISILNQKLYNKKVLTLCTILFAVLVATTLWAPAATLYPPRLVLGLFAAVVQLALLAVGILHYRAKPYDHIYALPVAMVGVWFVYMAIRLLF